MSINIDYDTMEIQKDIHRMNKEKGFWARPAEEEGVKETALLLVHSEVSEAAESLRDGSRANVEAFGGSDEDFETAFRKYIKDTYEDELADAAIRILDLSEASSVNLFYHVFQKLRYNQTRAHKHGKNF